MNLLDLYCGAGIAAAGYLSAGFTLIRGVDIADQPSYADVGELVQGDALELMRIASWPRALTRLDAVHASPPCQQFTRARKLRDAQGGKSKVKVDFLTPTIDFLRRHSQVPWVVENVEDARHIMQPQEGEFLTRLCGSHFGLKVQRHRLFLSSFEIPQPDCDHKTEAWDRDPRTGKPRPWGVYHVPGDQVPQGGRTARNDDHAREVMGIQGREHLTWDEIKEGFPPAYAEHVGKALAKIVREP